MFNKEKNTNGADRFAANNATLISEGTALIGDLNSENDLRIDGIIKGNVNTTAKIIIGATGFVDGNVKCQQADISGKVVGNVEVKELLQLRDQCNVCGNIAAEKLQIEPTATFNGKCQMGQNASVVQMSSNELQTAEAK